MKIPLHILLLHETIGKQVKGDNHNWFNTLDIKLC